MSNRTKVWLGIFLIILLPIAILYGGIKYRIDYAKTEVVTSASEDGRYTLKIYMIGEPEWPFGSTDCRFELMDNSSRLVKYSFSVQNDGKKMHEDNFQVVWSDKNVTISVSGEEQEEETFILNFDGTVN